MPAVNLGPSNSATVNTQSGLVAAQASGVTTGGLQINQGGAGVGAAPVSLMIAQYGLPVGIACTGTMGANGAVTMGTTLNVIYANAFFFFPAGAVFASSPAGFYFTRMTSTTVGTVFNNTYTAGSTPVIPSALVPVIDAGPGAFTGSTSQQVLTTATIPANVLGNNGALQLDGTFGYNNSAGTKTTNALWASAGTSFTVLGGAPTTTQVGVFSRLVINRGATNIQVSMPNGITFSTGVTASPVTQSTLDTTVASTISFALTLNTATDYGVLEYARIISYYST